MNCSALLFFVQLTITDKNTERSFRIFITLILMQFEVVW